MIRDCRAYLNGRGIGSSNEYDDSSGDNRIEGCAAWGNGGVGLGYDTGGIDLLYARRDEVRDSTAFLNQATGISLRGGVTNHVEADASFVRDSLSWGNLEYEFWIKAGENFNYYENSVAVGDTGNTDHLRHCVTGTGSAAGDDSIVLDQEAGLEPEREFADPENFDFRLQAGSRFVGAAPGGGDRGAFAYQERIRYLDPAGSDAADGLSAAGAFATLGRALDALSPGDTLYLVPRVHDGDVTITLRGTAEAPIAIRGRGREPAVLAGRVRIAGGAHVRFERVQFLQDVAVEDAEAIRFEHVVFRGSGTSLTAANTVELRATQCTFTGFSAAAVALPCSVATQLAGNLYDNRAGPALRLVSREAIRYSDYNSYAALDGAWEPAEGAGTAEELRAGHDRAARELVPAFVADGASVVLADPVPFQAGGTLGGPFGAFRRDVPRVELRLLGGPTVHSVSATTANLEWFTSHPAVSTLVWGRAPELDHETSLEANRFASLSLTGLEPGTTYQLRLDSLAIPEDVPILADPVTLTSAVLTFTTAAEDGAPRTFHVAEDGSDDNTGLAPETPLRTIQAAANRVGPGDTVLVAGGTYPETVRLRATGTPTAPISFLGQPGEQVLLDGAEALLDFAFVAGSKSHLRFDGFFFANHGATVSHSGAWEPEMGGQFNLYECRDVRISRVLSDGRTTADRLVVAKNVDGLQLVDTVDGNKLEGHYFENCPNLVVERSVFARPMIAAFILRNAADEPATIRNCIFTDSLAVKSYRDTLGNPNNVSLLIIDGSTEAVVLEDNLFFLRYYSPSERHLVGESGYDELDGVLLFGTVFADPQFQGVLDLLAAGGTLDRYDDGLPPFPPDSLWALERRFDFRTWLATDPAVTGAGLGLDPSRFDETTGLPR